MILHKNKYEVFYNARLKIYPGEEVPDEVLISEEFVFNPERWERAESFDSFNLASFGDSDEGDVPVQEHERGGSRQAWNRARRRGYDFIRSNRDLDAFVTLTFDDKQIDRTSWDEIVARISVWLDNRVRRNGLKYVLVPEFHLDGESYHFHGLMNFSALKLVDSGRKRHNKKVYNIADFPFGFTTVLRCSGKDRTKACAGYIYKYMGKNGAGCHQAGTHYMLAGGPLEKPRYKYYRVDFDAVDLPLSAVPYGAIKVTRDAEKIGGLLAAWESQNE